MIRFRNKPMMAGRLLPWWMQGLTRSGSAACSVTSISASGAGGQVITIFPDLNMVVVITGGNYHNDEGYPFKLMERFILPAVLEYSG
jgi:hypothetical protein